MDKFNNIKEIKEQFVKDGWSKDIEFVEYTLSDAKKDGVFDIEYNILKGKKYFKMISTENVFDSKGKVAFYNLKCHSNPLEYYEQDAEYFSEECIRKIDKIQVAKFEYSDKLDELLNSEWNKENNLKPGFKIIYNLKKAFRNNNMELASKYWKNIILYIDSITLPKEYEQLNDELLIKFRLYNSYTITDKLSNEEVYKITDYCKEKDYNAMKLDSKRKLKKEEYEL